jgi:hypothetical protein
MIDAYKHRCATMRHDLPIIHAHRPVGPFRNSSRATYGRFTRYDRTVLQFRYGEGRGFAELSRPIPHRLPRGRYPRN